MVEHCELGHGAAGLRLSEVGARCYNPGSVMLLGQKSAALHKPGQRLSCEPLNPGRSSREAPGDLSYMGWFLAHLLPRLAHCRLEDESDWRVLATGSHYAQLLGSRYMLNLIAWAAVQHAEDANSPAERLLCLLSRMPGGDVRLHTVLPYLKDPSHVGYMAAARVAEEAYRRADGQALQQAVDRLTMFNPESAEYCDPLMELLIAKACQDSLSKGTANLIGLIARLENLDARWRRVYELRICSLFLAETDCLTTGLLAGGFGLLQEELPEVRQGPSKAL